MTAPNVATFSRKTNVSLIAVGILLALLSGIFVIAMPSLSWHPGRDAELSATYLAFQETGVLLIKESGSGWTFAGSDLTGEFSAAVWDDDPGAYIIASVVGAIIGSPTPYAGLKIFLAALIALPLTWLPLTMARMFLKPAAGFSLLATPILFWLLNPGSLLAGTQYGQSDQVATLPVYALYGIAAALLFASLSLVLLLTTYKLKLSVLVTFSFLLVLLAVSGNLVRSLSGVGVALAVGLLWWLNTTVRRKLLIALAASTAAVLLMFGIQSFTMQVLNQVRADELGQTVESLPVSHSTWHPLYLGLAYPEPFTGEKSDLGVTWADEFGLEQAKTVDPDIVFGTVEYDQIIQTLFFEKLAENPLGVVNTYVQKMFYTLQHFNAFLVFSAVGIALALRRSGFHRKPLATYLIALTPALLLAFVPPVLVMPMLYFVSELHAILSVLAIVSLGAFGWLLADRSQTPVSNGVVN